VIVDQSIEISVSAIGAAIGEPARARILFSLIGGHARTSTELAIMADVSPSTASMHLARLKEQNLVAMVAQGKHHYYRLHGPDVAAALEALTVCAGGTARTVTTRTPSRLRAARTCYDHMAGQLGVLLHDRFRELGWLVRVSREDAYDVSDAGTAALASLGIDVAEVRALRRRFAYPCVDWSERRPHLGGALGGALLSVALKRRWVVQDLDDRALTVTSAGRREMRTRFGVPLTS
jgi:DNA-binding transcriptional ArsR family regulator